MIKKIYNKLVRDNIPAILKQSKIKHKVIVCPDEQLLTFTTRKLVEEVQELINAMLTPSEDNSAVLSELADVYSVLVKLGDLYDIDEADLLEFEEQKTETNGAFDEGYILQWVEEEIVDNTDEQVEELVIPPPTKKSPKKKPPKP